MPAALMMGHHLSISDFCRSRSAAGRLARAFLARFDGVDHVIELPKCAQQSGHSVLRLDYACVERPTCVDIALDQNPAAFSHRGLAFGTRGRELPIEARFARSQIDKLALDPRVFSSDRTALA